MKVSNEVDAPLDGSEFLEGDEWPLLKKSSLTHPFKQNFTNRSN